MSAFLVNPEHIGQVVSWHFSQPMHQTNFYNLHTRQEIKFIDKQPKASQIAIMIAGANAASIKSRYPDNHHKIIGDLTDYLAACSQAARGGPQIQDPASIINMVNCLDYQSCEVENWQQSNAYWILKVIKDHATTKLVKLASTEDTIAWEYQPPINTTNLLTIDFKSGRVQ